MSAIPKLLNGDDSHGSAEAGAGGDLARDGRVSPLLGGFHTPPSNTGVNDGVPQYEMRRSTKKPPKTIGTFRSSRSGRFVDKSPDSDPELRADVLRLVEALDLVVPALDFLLVDCVKSKRRQESVTLAQALSVVAGLRVSVSDSLAGLGVAVPVAPALGSIAKRGLLK